MWMRPLKTLPEITRDTQLIRLERFRGVFPRWAVSVENED